MLLRGVALSTKSGMGGVISRLGGEGLRELEDCGLVARSRPKLLEETRGLEPVMVVRLFDRMRLNGRAGQAMAWFERGLAMMLVPGVAAGGGVGLSVLKRGWMCASLTAGLGGREMSGIIFGGGASSSSSSSGSSERKGPSRARAGEFGRLPGIGSSVVPLEGAV